MNYKNIILAVCIGISSTISAQSVYPGQHRGKMEKETTIPLWAESFDLKDVRLLPSRFRENMMRDSAWMASIEVNLCCIVSALMPVCLPDVRAAI